MEGINSDINKFSPPQEDSSLSDEKITGSDQAKTEFTFIVSKASDIMSTNGVGRHKLPNAVSSGAVELPIRVNNVSSQSAEGVSEISYRNRTFCSLPPA